MDIILIEQIHTTEKDKEINNNKKRIEYTNVYPIFLFSLF